MIAIPDKPVTLGPGLLARNLPLTAGEQGGKSNTRGSKRSRILGGQKESVPQTLPAREARSGIRRNDETSVRRCSSKSKEKTRRYTADDAEELPTHLPCPFPSLPPKTLASRTAAKTMETKTRDDRKRR